MALQTLNFVQDQKQKLFFSDPFILAGPNASVQIETPQPRHDKSAT